MLAHKRVPPCHGNLTACSRHPRRVNTQQAKLEDNAWGADKLCEALLTWLVARSDVRRGLNERLDVLNLARA